MAQSRSLAAARAAPMIRSIRPGGSMRPARQRANSASRNRSSETSSGATSSLSHAVRESSSGRVASRKPRASRTCARWYWIVRPDQAYLASWSAPTLTWAAR